ncbi:hypothetical protein K2X33_06940 [bacterium]|nr:hypothetical protein [bacterium]
MKTFSFTGFAFLVVALTGCVSFPDARWDYGQQTYVPPRRDLCNTPEAQGQGASDAQSFQEEDVSLFNGCAERTRPAVNAYREGYRVAKTELCSETGIEAVARADAEKGSSSKASICAFCPTASSRYYTEVYQIALLEVQNAQLRKQAHRPTVIIREESPSFRDGYAPKKRGSLLANCRIDRHGDAQVSIVNEGRKTVSGDTNWLIRYFDAEGDFISSERESSIQILMPGSTGEFRARAPTDALSCSATHKRG